MSFLEFTEDERLPAGPSAKQGEKRQTQTARPNYKAAPTWAIGTLLAAGVLLYIAAPNRVSPPQQLPLTVSDARSDSQAPITRPIETIRVGERVLAHNPEVAAAERAAFANEPAWNTWLQLSLLMPKPDGSELRIEMLRSEDWVRSQLRYVVDDPKRNYVERPSADDELPQDSGLQSNSANHYVALVPRSPIRPIVRELAITTALFEQAGYQRFGFTIQMDLPELGLTGEAFLIDISPCPPIEESEGQVVTATFQHSSGDLIDLVVADDSNSPDPETIGTTANHPFWSVDRQEYVQASSLNQGERLRTFQGDTKRVVSKLPRPGPQAVYNLEVYGEHVYFVGEEGLLVHNSYNLNNNSAKANFGVYEIHVNGSIFKVGKVDLGRVTKTSGLPTRIHQQVRRLEKVFGKGSVVGKVVDDLGETTTLAAKQAEHARILDSFKTTGFVPLGNWKSFKP